MDEHGFDKQVLVLARPPVWLGMERSEIHRLTRVANDSLAEFVAGAATGSSASVSSPSSTRP